MESLVIFVHVIAAIGITGLVLIQHGKGADMGASFGSGASQTMFGSVGSGNALTKSTSWLAIVFFATSLALALFAKQQTAQSIEDDGLIQNAGVLEETLAPALSENTLSDVPEAAATEQPVLDAPAVDETLQAAADPAAAEAVEEAAAETEEPAEAPAQ